MSVTIRLLRNALPRRLGERAKFVGYVHRAFDMRMENIRAAVDAQGLLQGPMDGGTAVISSGFHSSPTCPQNHLTVRLFVSTGEYAAVAHVFANAEPTYFLAANDRTSLGWKNTSLNSHIGRLEPGFARWHAK